jgi:iron uptake system component EfeO
VNHVTTNLLRSRRAVLAIVACSLAITGLAACGSDESSSGGGAKKVSVSLGAKGCEPADLKADAGPATFEVKNEGKGSLNEMEVLKGALILGERENITEGLTSRFSLNLKPGTYDISCNDGSNHDPTGKLTVTGSAPPAKANKQLDAAAERYASYVQVQTDRLVTATTAFAAAVEAGDVAKAKATYQPARVYYERVEPVAESFGDLDPRIDARVNDVEKGQKWTGFHPIEQALYEKGTLAGTAPLAKRLVTDTKELQRKVKSASYEPTQLANGAVELLNEVSKSKITGEEERYSHTDLTDFKANVDGADAAFVLLRPALAKRDAKLADTVTARFAALNSELAPYRIKGDIYENYAKLDQAQRRKLSQAVDALAQPLAQVGGKIVGE